MWEARKFIETDIKVVEHMNDGWEPFTVTLGRFGDTNWIWLRKETREEEVEVPVQSVRPKSRANRRDIKQAKF